MKVIIESPYAGNVDENIDYAQECLLDSLQRGEAPIASHLLHTQVLDDNILEERKMGVDAGLEWYDVADKIVFYIDNCMSEGMRQAEKKAKAMGKEVEYRMLVFP